FVECINRRTVGVHVSVHVSNYSLKYYHTVFYGRMNNPEFFTLQMVDDVQINHWDSITNKKVTKQEWMKSITEEDPQYWESQTEVCVDQQQWFRDNTEMIKKHLNHTEGLFYFLSYMYGCTWNDQTDDVFVYQKFGYDGEDLLVWDIGTNSWVTAQEQAHQTKVRWDHETAKLEHTRKYLTKDCPQYLKKYVDYGRSSLKRTVPPLVSLLQKTPSSEVTCHATGFYPDETKMVWRRDGEELHEGVVKGEILPNNDETFQMNWRRYDCVFQLSGVNEIITKLDKAKIRTNEASAAAHLITIVISTAAFIVFIGCVIGFIIYKIKSGEATKISKHDFSF
uniref:Ig-like domain-containing protein n=1 Tax=Amphilophus citrinellus TaxID=61819 RepID=A0A3Q0R3N2_AMPCI